MSYYIWVNYSPINNFCLCHASLALIQLGDSPLHLFSIFWGRPLMISFPVGISHCNLMKINTLVHVVIILELRHPEATALVHYFKTMGKVSWGDLALGNTMLQTPLITACLIVALIFHILSVSIHPMKSLFARFFSLFGEPLLGLRGHGIHHHLITSFIHLLYRPTKNLDNFSRCLPEKSSMIFFWYHPSRICTRRKLRCTFTISSEVPFIWCWGLRLQIITENLSRRVYFKEPFLTENHYCQKISGVSLITANNVSFKSVYLWDHVRVRCLHVPILSYYLYTHVTVLADCAKGTWTLTYVFINLITNKFQSRRCFLDFDIILENSFRALSIWVSPKYNWVYLIN